MMTYKSPIEIVVQDINTKIDNDIMQIVQTYGIDVDKTELIRALNYDRKMYEKGYGDGKYDRLHESTKPYKVDKRWHCGECSTAVGRYWKYCQRCGQRIGWEEVTDEDAG